MRARMSARPISDQPTKAKTTTINFITMPTFNYLCITGALVHGSIYDNIRSEDKAGN